MNHPSAPGGQTATGGQSEFDIIVTIDTREISGAWINECIARGATIFRINTSFIESDEIAPLVERLRAIMGSRARILLDLPGFKIRSLYLPESLHLKALEPQEFLAEWFNHPEFLKMLAPGMKLRINDGMIVLEVTAATPERMTAVPNRDTILKRGKGIHIDGMGFGHLARTMSHTDKDIIEAARSCDVDYLGLSFVRSARDIAQVEELLVGTKIRCIPKIEARESLDALHEILVASRTVIIDRGDLAGETGLEHVWRLSRHIISHARLLDTRVIVATQFLLNMVSKPLPSLAEIDSLYSLLNFQIDGVQLSEETSVGEYALEAVEFLANSIKDFEHSHRRKPGEGMVLWIMGPTGAGKTTLAQALYEKLRTANYPAVILDGDEIRNSLGEGLGFGPGDRLRVVSNLVHHANKHARDGALVIVSALTAHEEARALVRQSIERLMVVYLRCSIEACADRDTRKMYARAHAGEINTLIGVSEPYLEPPAHAVDLHVDTQNHSPEESLAQIIGFLMNNGHLDDLHQSA